MAKVKGSRATGSQSEKTKNKAEAFQPVGYSVFDMSTLMPIVITLVIIVIFFFLGFMAMSGLLLVILLAAFCIFWMPVADVTEYALPGGPIARSLASDSDDILAASFGEVVSDSAENGKHPSTNNKPNQKNSKSIKAKENNDYSDDDD